jgi:hypothetical protein
VLDLSRGRALLLALSVVLGTSLLLQVPITLSQMAGMKTATAALRALTDP